MFKYKYLLYFIIIFALYFQTIRFAWADVNEVGKIENIIGEGIVFDGKNYASIQINMLIRITDIITTKQKSLIKIIFFDGSDIVLYENSELKIKEYHIIKEENNKSIKSVIDNIKGKVRFFIKPKENAKNDVQLKTSNAVMGIRGTEGYIVTTGAEQTQLVVTKGAVEFSNPSTPNIIQVVNENEWGQVIANAPPPPPEPVTPELIDALEVKLPEGFDTNSLNETEQLFPNTDGGLPVAPPTIPSTPEIKPTPEIQGKSDIKNEMQPSSDNAQAQGKTFDIDADQLIIGPTFGVGLFQFFTIGIEAKIFKFLGLSINYGGAGDIHFDTFPGLLSYINRNSNENHIYETKLSIQHIKTRVVIYPFFGAFFAGAELGIRHIETNVHATNFSSSNPVEISARYKLNTFYFNPQFGWMWVFDSGFAIGTEFGAQIPLSSNNENFSNVIFAQNPAQLNSILVSSAYNDFLRANKDDIGNYLKTRTLPYWNIIKIGWFF